MTINAIADELAAILEPDATLRNDSRARPTTYDIDTLYLWPRRESFVAIDTGQQDEQRFELLAAWAADRLDEADEPSREVSDQIADRADAMARTLAGTRAGATFERAAVVEIDYEGLKDQDRRGFLARITGYQHRSD